VQIALKHLELTIREIKYTSTYSWTLNKIYMLPRVRNNKYQKYIPSVVLAAPPEDEQVMLET
jgi:hypothetical protein